MVACFTLKQCPLPSCNTAAGEPSDACPYESRTWPLDLILEFLTVVVQKLVSYSESVALSEGVCKAGSLSYNVVDVNT